MLIISSVASAQNNSTLSKEGLHGKVKVLLLTEYEVDDKFGKLIKGKIKYVEKHFYDNSGNRKKLIKYGIDGNPREELRYHYNSKNSVNEFTVINVAGVKARENRLGKPKNKLEKEIRDLNSTDFVTYFEDFFYKYDKKGNVIEDNLGMSSSENFTDFEGAMGLKNKYYYDNNNKIIKRELYGESNPNEIALTWVKRWDSNGNLIEKIESSDYGINERIVNNYNSNNDIINQKIYNYKGVMVENTSLEYLEYDVNKNWVKRIFYRNDYPLVIVERDIKYHK